MGASSINKVVASPWRVIVRIWPWLLEGIQ